MDSKTSYKSYFRYYKKIGPLLKKPRVKAYTMLVLSFFTMSFFGVFAIKPALKTIARLKKEISDSRKVNQALEKKIINLSSLKEEYQKIETDIPLISKALPSQPQLPSFLKDLEIFAQEVGATISGIRVQKVALTKEGSRTSTKISSSLTLNGDYFSCKKFLNRLLNAKRIYTVESLEIRADLKRKESIIKLDLKVNAYYL